MQTVYWVALMICVWAAQVFLLEFYYKLACLFLAFLRVFTMLSVKSRSIYREQVELNNPTT